MAEFELQPEQAPTIEALQKEIRGLKRKLSLAEINLDRARQVSAAQYRVETLLNESYKKDIQFFKLVLENATNILLLLDFDGRFAYASNAFLEEVGIENFGLINGLHFKDVLRPILAEENLARLTAAVDRAVVQKRTVTMEEQIDFHAKGWPRTYTIFITPMTSDDGKGTGILAWFNDITDINEALEAAKRASLAKSEFLANMSHEIRTPMNAIIGMTSIGKKSADADRKDYCLSRIESASNHLLGIINDILDMSKIEANRLELSSEEFDFEDMLRQVVNVNSFRVDEKKQKLSVRIDRAIPKVLVGDDQRLTQIITNLIGNAIKFTPDGGAIKLDAALESEKKGVYTIRFKVSDTGIGISKDQQARIFSAFQQAETNTTRKFGGTGLGLAISKNLVEMMDGKIWIESELGVGSTFCFTIQAERGANGGAPPANIPWKALRFIVVDAEEEDLRYLAEILRGFGARCDTAASAREALRLVERNAYDFCFIDWKTPDIEEMTTAAAMLNRFGRVILMSSLSDWNRIEKTAGVYGVEQFISKPIFPSSVEDVIVDALGSAQAATASKEAPTSFEGGRILLAEDMDINREIVLALLEPTQLRIDCAENGLEAVRAFQEAPGEYALIFMDVQMPEMDGYEATRRIREMEAPNAKTVPIIAMTANVFKEDIDRCLAAGMNGHIGKPLDFDEVFSVLQKYL